MAKQSTKNKLDTSALRPASKIRKTAYVAVHTVHGLCGHSSCHPFMLLSSSATLLDLIIAKGLVDFDGIINIIIKLGVIVTVTGIAQWLMSLCTNKITYCVVRDIRNDSFRKAPKATPFLYRLPPSR